MADEGRTEYEHEAVFRRGPAGNSNRGRREVTSSVGEGGCSGCRVWPAAHSWRKEEKSTREREQAAEYATQAAPCRRNVCPATESSTPPPLSITDAAGDEPRQ